MATMMQDEQQLAERAARRDHTAFATLYSHYVEKIYRYIYYKVSNHAEAEDLCEQVFLKAWEAIDRYTWHGYPFSSWLYRLAHNLVVDHYRTQRETLPINDAVLSFEEGLDPDQYLARSIASNELRAAIEQLTGEQRQVVCLKFILGYDNAEIALLMKKKEGAIRALQFRALRNLQQLLEKEGQAADLFTAFALPVTA